LAAISILAVNSLNLNWEVWGEAVLIVISIIDAVLTFIYAKTDNIYIMQICYIIYRSLYQVMITISQWNIAKNLKSDNFALVFGCNSFFALLMQCILTAIVTDSHGLDMGIREQVRLFCVLD
jgi:thiamine transporter 2/3